VVLSGGVFQNELLLRDIKSPLEAQGFRIWTNHLVPPNDGGISLGQAALAALTNHRSAASFEKTESAWTAQVS
jgi:hydrogenase maturation protein HypF